MPGTGITLDDLHLDHDEQHPDGSDGDGYARKRIAGLGTKGAGAARSPKSTGQSATFTALNQNDQHQKQAEANDNQVRPYARKIRPE